MPKTLKPLSSKKAPEAADNHADIDDWIRTLMPDLQPLVKRLDKLIRDTIPGLQYAVKWKKAYYRSRYVKLKTMEEVQDPSMRKWIKQAKSVRGWK
jgi:hypothetical protein